LRGGFRTKEVLSAGAGRLFGADSCEVCDIQSLSDAGRVGGWFGAEMVVAQFSHELFPELGTALLK
jgi:hypothetical protein